MTALSSRIAWAAAVFLSAAVTMAQPPQGSQLPLDENTCATCHGEKDLWDGETLRLYVPTEGLAHDVHWQKGVNCHDCHGGDPSSFDVPVAHATEAGDEASGIRPFHSPLSEIRKACANCHQEEHSGLEMGSHSSQARPEEDAKPLPTDCAECHGDKAHEILSQQDPRSPTYPANQLRLCGQCHQEELGEYKRSVHGHGLLQAGLMVTAVCADCHGAHQVLPADQPASTLHVTNVAQTCGTCHRFIEERLKRSVHGSEAGPGAATEQPAPGGATYRKPSCTDCHQGHDLPDPSSDQFQLSLSGRCGSCHVDPSARYGMSMHGELTDLGYVASADCSDCHGSHDIVPLSDPQSPLAPANRTATCMKCHESMAANLIGFDPHADHRDPDRNPLLYWVYLVLMTLLISTFAFFGLHSVVWFLRGLWDVKQHGRPPGLKPGAIAYRRFKPFHRAAHTVMVISFLGLAMTGLPLKYSQYQWAQTLSDLLGGFESTGLWHRVFGVVNIACLFAYATRMASILIAPRLDGGSRVRRVFSNDSPVPSLRDLKDFVRMLRWFVGLGPKPTFERWAYWEKFDFWGASADIVIIGFTGLILWFPNLFCAFLPGETLNVAKLIHSTQALLATGFVFAIHFFNTHLRPEKFPMDMSVLTGLVSEEELREERPEYFERLQWEGKLEDMKIAAPSRTGLALVFTSGAIAFLIGMALLVGIFVGVFGG